MFCNLKDIDSHIATIFSHVEKRVRATTSTLFAEYLINKDIIRRYISKKMTNRIVVAAEQLFFSGTSGIHYYLRRMKNLISSQFFMLLAVVL